jgi:hypothetical protein
MADYTRHALVRRNSKVVLRARPIRVAHRNLPMLTVPMHGY